MRSLLRSSLPTTWRRALTALVALVALTALAGCAPGSNGPNGRQTSAPLVVNGVTFRRYTDPTFGFSLEIPALLTQNGAQPDPSGGGGITAFNGVYPDASSALGLFIATATKGMPTSLCQQGTPITIGSGQRAYEDDIYTQPTPRPAPNSGAPANSRVEVGLVSHGVYISITLQGMPPDATFTQRYGAIWRAMLASFTPVTTSGAGDPCDG